MYLFGQVSVANDSFLIRQLAQQWHRDSDVAPSVWSSYCEEVQAAVK